MSVSLNRLYHFLQHICDTDMIIYHWYPHGSRKLEDLMTPFESNIPSTLYYELTTPQIIFHDQEPLNLNYWSDQDLLATFRRIKPNIRFKENIDDWIIGLHLRVCINAPFNIFKNTILVHSEKNSKDVELYAEKNFIPVYYWCHALIARDWFRYAAIDPKLRFNVDNITADFLIYSRAWSGTREYRLKFSELLLESNLLSNCKVKFNPVDNGSHYTNHQYVNESFKVHRHDIENYFPYNDHDSATSADYNNEDYAQCGIEVVLETLFDATKHHLTEKTLRAIACGKPFMLAATPGSLQYLRDYGFKTFHPYINEQYGLCQNPLKRLNMIVDEMKRISQLSLPEKIVLWQQLYQISEYNKNLFFSNDWHNTIVDEYKLNMSTALSLTYSQQSSEYHDKIASVVANPLPPNALGEKMKILFDKIRK
jgi:hypothetical protein